MDGLKNYLVQRDETGFQKVVENERKKVRLLSIKKGDLFIYFSEYVYYKQLVDLRQHIFTKIKLKKRKKPDATLTVS